MPIVNSLHGRESPSSGLYGEHLLFRRTIGVLSRTYSRSPPIVNALGWGPRLANAGFTLIVPFKRFWRGLTGRPDYLSVACVPSIRYSDRVATHNSRVPDLSTLTVRAVLDSKLP